MKTRFLFAIIVTLVAGACSSSMLGKKVKELKNSADSFHEPAPHVLSPLYKKETSMIIEKSDDILSLETQLRQILDANVDINLKKDKGSITIHFNSFDQMDDIIQKLRHHHEQESF